MSIYFINIPLLEDLYKDKSFFYQLLNAEDSHHKNNCNNFTNFKNVWELIIMKENFELITFFLDKIKLPEIEFIRDSAFLENFSILFFSKKTSGSSELFSQTEKEKNQSYLEGNTFYSNKQNDFKNIFKDIKEKKKTRPSFIQSKLLQ